MPIQQITENFAPLIRSANYEIFPGLVLVKQAYLLSLPKIITYVRAAPTTTPNYFI
jgi:hypothetical protein